MSITGKHFSISIFFFLFISIIFYIFYIESTGKYRVFEYLFHEEYKNQCEILSYTGNPYYYDDGFYEIVLLDEVGDFTNKIFKKIDVKKYNKEAITRPKIYHNYYHKYLKDGEHVYSSKMYSPNLPSVFHLPSGNIICFKRSGEYWYKK